MRSSKTKRTSETDVARGARLVSSARACSPLVSDAVLRELVNARCLALRWLPSDVLRAAVEHIDEVFPAFHLQLPAAERDILRSVEIGIWIVLLICRGRTESGERVTLTELHKHGVDVA